MVVGPDSQRLAPRDIARAERAPSPLVGLRDKYVARVAHQKDYACVGHDFEDLI